MNAPVSANAFRPWESTDKLALRDRLLNCQRLAANRAARTVSDNARVIFWMICDYAGRSAHSTAPIERLEEDRQCLLRLFMAGNSAELLEGE